MCNRQTVSTYSFPGTEPRARDTDNDTELCPKETEVSGLIQQCRTKVSCIQVKWVPHHREAP